MCLPEWLASSKLKTRELAPVDFPHEVDQTKGSHSHLPSPSAPPSQAFWDSFSPPGVSDVQGEPLWWKSILEILLTFVFI